MKKSLRVGFAAAVLSAISTTTGTAHAASANAVDAAATTLAAALPQCTTWDMRYVQDHDGGQIVVDIPSTSSHSSNCYKGTSTYSHATVPLQVALRVCYNKNIDTDGIFGPATRTALKEVQRTLGVSDDGVYGPATGKKMKWQLTYGAVSGSRHDPGDHYACRASSTLFN